MKRCALGGIAGKYPDNYEVVISDIKAEPESVFHKATIFNDKKDVSYIWKRDILTPDKWVMLHYSISEKSPNDPAFPDENLDETSKVWVEFILNHDPDNH